MQGTVAGCGGVGSGCERSCEFGFEGGGAVAVGCRRGGSFLAEKCAVDAVFEADPAEEGDGDGEVEEAFV